MGAEACQVYGGTTNSKMHANAVPLLIMGIIMMFKPRNLLLPVPATPPRNPAHSRYPQPLPPALVRRWWSALRLGNSITVPARQPLYWRWRRDRWGSSLSLSSALGSRQAIRRARPLAPWGLCLTLTCISHDAKILFHLTFWHLTAGAKLMQRAQGGHSDLDLDSGSSGTGACAKNAITSKRDTQSNEAPLLLHIFLFFG